MAYNGFNLRTAGGELYAMVTGPGDLRIDATSSINLAAVDVFNGDLEVTSGGSILAQELIIQTDSYANRLELTAVGAVSFVEEPVLFGGLRGISDMQVQELRGKEIRSSSRKA